MRLSEDKLNKIKEEILSLIFQNSPKAMFSSEIANNIIRDEEFTKKLLLELESKKLITRVTKNNQGIPYLKRIKWRLTSPVYDAYARLNKHKITYNEKDNHYISS